MRNNWWLAALIAAAVALAGCTRTATPQERAVETPRETAPAAPPEEIGLDEEVEIPDIEVDTRTRIPKP